MYSYPNDVWGLGVLVVWVDLDKCPFGKDRLRRGEIAVVVADAFHYLCTLRGLVGSSIIKKVRTPGGVHSLVQSSHPKPPHTLAWGFARGLEFRVFTQACLTIKSSCRPLAANLGQLGYLNIPSPVVDRETPTPTK